MGDAIPSWDNLDVSPDSLKTLEELIARAKQLATGAQHGLTVLFVGGDTRGRQLAAELIAAELNSKLYHIDLGSVTSKYIGETEKNLEKIFDAAERSTTILFFDEADALFGKRTEVTDANDRYANQEINFLLQRIESHKGLVILATNDTRNIDAAFLRRVAAQIEFKSPGRS